MIEQGEMVITSITFSQPDVAREACTPTRLTLSPWWWAAKPQPAGRKVACVALVRHSACWNIVNQSPTCFGMGQSRWLLDAYIQWVNMLLRHAYHAQHGPHKGHKLTPFGLHHLCFSASLNPLFIPKPPRSSLFAQAAWRWRQRTMAPQPRHLLRLK
jgi:hypothetical protein